MRPAVYPIVQPRLAARRDVSWFQRTHRCRLENRVTARQSRQHCFARLITQRFHIQRKCGRTDARGFIRRAESFHKGSRSSSMVVCDQLFPTPQQGEGEPGTQFRRQISFGGLQCVSRIGASDFTQRIDGSRRGVAIRISQ